MALTKVKLIADGTIVQSNLHASHGITTADIGENASYLYYTDARARAAVSVSGNALSYNSSTGVITSNFEESPTFTGNVVIDGTLGVGARTTITDSAGYLFDVQTTDTNQPRLQVYVDDTSGVSLISGYNTTPKPMLFYTGGSERMRIDSSGITTFYADVNIEEASTPTIQLKDTTNNYYLLLRHNNTNAIFDTHASSYYEFKIGDSHQMSLTTTGLGIGLTSPSYKLHVSGSANNIAGFTSSATTTALRIDNTHSNGWGSNLAIYTGGTAAGFFGTIGSLLGNTSQDLSIYATTGNAIRFYTNGPYERMRIDSSGRVGINNNNPGYKLDVTHIGADAINVNASNDFTGIRWSSDQHTYSWRVGGDNFFIYDVVNSAQRVTLNASGNLGIGRTDPNARLDIKGAGGGTGLTFETSDASNNQTFYINDGGRAGMQYYPFTIGMASGTSAATGARFQVATTGGDFVILNDGKTGIGTTSPESGAKLDVRAGAGGKVVFGSYDANYKVVIEAGDQLNFYNGASATTAYINYSQSGTPGDVLLSRNLLVEANSSGGVSGTVRIKSNGSVGIGTTSPGGKLDVVHPNSGTDETRKEIQRWLHDGQNAMSLFAYGNTADTIQLAAWGSEQNISIVTETLSSITKNTTKGIYIKSGGNVGIGNAAPGHKLDVYQDRIALTGLSAGGSGHYIALSGQLPGYAANLYNCLETNLTDLHFAAGGVYTGYISYNSGFTDVSDISLKENIEDIPDALNKVNNLRGRYFTWKNELQGNDKQIGFIAQEVEEYIPEAVTSGAGGTKGIAYGKITALLVNAIKELKADNDSLRARIEILENN